MKFVAQLVLCSIGLIVGTSAQAGFTTRFASTPGGTDSNGAGIYMWKQGGSGNQFGTYVPGYVLTGTSGSAPNTVYHFQTFCIQRSQNISTGNNYTYSVVHLTEAPVPGTNKITAAQATALKRMWATFQDGLGTDLAKNQAFQYAVWYLIGQFAGAPTNGTVAGYFNTYKNSANWGTTEANLAALANETSQDQIFELEDGYGPSGGELVEVPVPPAVVLVVAGVASGLFLRRRIAGQPAVVA